MSDFAFSGERTRQAPAGNLWLTVFSSVLCAVLLAGVLLGIGVRCYIHWSVSDTLKSKPTQPPTFSK